jgi:CRISPR-associated protein Cmr1
MQRLEYKVSFVTPAFLGNAEQAGQWRTPPFKALLRQWWRVVHAPSVNYDVEALRRDEGALFGVAADGGDSRRSLARFRLLDGWNPGDYNQVEDSGRVCHPEVDRGGPPCDAGPGRKISANLYLGYGPIGVNGLARPPAIAPDATKGNTLSIVTPESHAPKLLRAIALAAWFGNLGSRSRNGWGALQLEARPETDTPLIPALTRASLNGVLRPLAQCLQLDWPHAIGTDEKGPLVWHTAPKGSWREVIKELARIKIAFRTQAALSLVGVTQGQFAERHLLAYPVTHHGVNGAGWGNQGRLASQLRFKVTRQGDQWRGVLVHVPCRLPAEMVAGLVPQRRRGLDAAAAATWQAVHAVIDRNAERI